MKRILFTFPIVLFLSGCAQVFDGNLYTAVDAPPPLKASDLSTTPVATLQNMVNKDPSFLASLKNDPAALAAVQAQLATAFTPTLATSAKTGTADQKAAVINAAQAYVLATAFGTNAGTVVTDAIKQATNLVSGGTPATAIQNLMAGKTTAQITALLTEFAQINTALNAMQTAATTGTTVNATTFFGSTTSKGDLSQIALVAAAASALVADNTDIATLAAKMASGASITTGGSALSKVSSALGGTADPASNPYAYLSVLPGIPH